MHRSFKLLLFTVGILSLSFAPPAKDDTTDLKNQKWYFMSWGISTPKLDHQLIFLQDGILNFDGTVEEDYVWEQSGDEIVMKFNNAYATYTGKLSSPTTMTGKARNVNGMKWKWFAIRVK